MFKPILDLGFRTYLGCKIVWAVTLAIAKYFWGGMAKYFGDRLTLKILGARSQFFWEWHGKSF